jgi:coenzyme F420-reducing hydrogenase gamma subunit
MSKPQVAIFDLAGCEGCQLQIVNLEDSLLQLLSLVDVVEWREAISNHGPEIDIALVEGCLEREEDVARLLHIREKSKILVALGSCAISGGVHQMRNALSSLEARQITYGNNGFLKHLDVHEKVQSLDQIVKVDYSIPGCPIHRQELSYVLRCLALGRIPFIPTYPVCVECRIQENLCLWQQGQLCLGPLTRAGCHATCPSHGTPCIGCRGYSSDANPQGLRQSLNRYHKTPEEFEHHLNLFLGSSLEHAHA